MKLFLELNSIECHQNIVQIDLFEGVNCINNGKKFDKNPKLIDVSDKQSPLKSFDGISSSMSHNMAQGSRGTQK